jgi:hypothetical protein
VITAPESQKLQVTREQRATIITQLVQGPAGTTGPAGNALPPIAFAYGDASPSVRYTLPKRSLITACSINIRTAFNGVGAQLAVGTPGNPEGLMPVTHNDPGTVGQYENSPDLELPAGSQITLSITPGAGASRGSGVVVLELLALE